MTDLHFVLSLSPEFRVLGLKFDVLSISRNKQRRKQNWCNSSWVKKHYPGGNSELQCIKIDSFPSEGLKTPKPNFVAQINVN